MFLEEVWEPHHVGRHGEVVGDAVLITEVGGADKDGGAIHLDQLSLCGEDGCRGDGGYCEISKYRFHFQLGLDLWIYIVRSQNIQLLGNGIIREVQERRAGLWLGSDDPPTSDPEMLSLHPLIVKVKPSL